MHRRLGYAKYRVARLSFTFTSIPHEPNMSEDVEELWVCAGRRYWSGEKRSMQVWYTLKDNKVDTNDRTQFHAFAKKGLASAHAGQVFQIHVTHKDGGALSVDINGPTRPRFESVWDGPQAVSLVAEWRALTEVAKGEEDYAKRKLKADGQDPLIDALKPVTKAYAGSSVPGRRALLVRVLEIVQSGR